MFPYTKPFDWHFRYRHIVDDHNNFRHALPNLETTWITERWPIRVFTFLLAITEVNCYLAFRYFVWRGEDVPTLVQFRRDLAWAFIKNPLLEETEERPFEPDTHHVGTHDIMSAPNHASNYRNRTWICEAKQPHQQYTCKWRRCSIRTRNFRACTPGCWLCPLHVVQHAILATKKEILGD